MTISGIMNHPSCSILGAIMVANAFLASDAPGQDMTTNMPGQMALSTVLIEVETRSSSATATGFFFGFCNTDSGSVPAIVTNRHVVNGAINGSFIFTAHKGDGQPDLGNTLRVDLKDFESRWILHPDAEIDLAVMPIASVIAECEDVGFEPYFKALSTENIPNQDQLEELMAIEDIIMVGYPKGIWDNQNNLPVFRRGITATHPAIKYRGQEEFLIDAACFPGSSGSPVFLFNMGNYVSNTGSTVIGTRFYLLGVLYSGPVHIAGGEIRVIEVPESTYPVTATGIPINLGYVIRSDQLLAFEEFFKEAVQR
jgi:hypothetical protein